MGVGLGQNAHVILINLHICLAHTHSSFSIPSVAFFEGPGLIFLRSESTSGIERQNCLKEIFLQSVQS